MNYFGIKWTKMKIYLYLCMYTVRENPFMYMYLYTIPGQKQYVLVEFHFCKFYHEGANIYCVDDKITPSVSKI